MKSVILIFLFLLEYTNIHCQKLEFVSDSVILWTRQKGNLVNPKRIIFAVPNSTIWIEEKYKRIRIIHKGIVYFTIIKTFKKGKRNGIQVWSCINELMDGNEKCKIELIKGDDKNKLTTLSVYLGKRVYVYYCKNN